MMIPAVWRAIEQQLRAASPADAATTDDGGRGRR
ncbi:MAG: hypothetical protein H6Q90_7051 [Deltaproteobacteria bacterium]|nr:hypothetical protein [Deltaproteobacteria bacterium]